MVYRWLVATYILFQIVMDSDFSNFAQFSCHEGEEHVVELLTNELEGSGNPRLATDSRVPGRILGHQEVYKDFGASPYICKLVERGYRLEFEEVPPPSFTRNNKSALSKPDFVLAELRRLEKLGCIRRVKKPPRVVLPLSVVYSKKWRLVVDASRTLNP